MTSQEFEEIVEKYLNNTCSPEEAQFINEWFEKLGEDKPNRLSVDDQLLLHNKILTQLTTHIKKTTNKPKVSWFTHRLLYKIAAGLLILAVSIFYLPIDLTVLKEKSVLAQEHEVEILNTETLPKKIDLADGSTVTLQPGSTLRVSKTYANTREVHLSGEAFFKVKRNIDKPFMVYSREIVTKVLGTSFNVKAYDSDKEITIAVKTGSVSVSNESANKLTGASQKEVILKRNQQAIYDRTENSIVMKLVDNPQVTPSLTSLDMQYKNFPVSNIFKDLEKGYGIDIQFDEAQMKNCFLTTTLLNENFHERLNIICKAIGAQYEVTDTLIVVKTHKGCDKAK